MKTAQEKIEEYEAKIAELKKEIENEKIQSTKDFFLQIVKLHKVIDDICSPR